ncbi:hypothetical protein BpHYR1_046400 [Brachionus plicatilis]|uniref:Uncharacterized protein n=1 Tax=Brachionus plicatilis TaxID=10195 RepID=A0A3M7RI50_BRAPC|nr:hypothetical protein BpHYR1_046400 [Brachionus plicatilis]
MKEELMKIQKVTSVIKKKEMLNSILSKDQKHKNLQLKSKEVKILEDGMLWFLPKCNVIGNGIETHSIKNHSVPFHPFRSIPSVPSIPLTIWYELNGWNGMERMEWNG